MSLPNSVINPCGDPGFIKPLVLFHIQYHLRARPCAIIPMTMTLPPVFIQAPTSPRSLRPVSTNLVSSGTVFSTGPFDCSVTLSCFIHVTFNVLGRTSKLTRTLCYSMLHRWVSNVVLYANQGIAIDHKLQINPGTSSPRNDQITPQHPLLARRHLLALMQHAMIPMPMQQRHPNLRLDRDRFRIRIYPRRLGVEHCFPASARRQIDKKGPSRAGWNGFCRGCREESKRVGFVVCQTRLISPPSPPSSENDNNTYNAAQRIDPPSIDISEYWDSSPTPPHPTSVSPIPRPGLHPTPLPPHPHSHHTHPAPAWSSPAPSRPSRSTASPQTAHPPPGTGRSRAPPRLSSVFPASW